jgi:hypothetical protein
MTVTVHKIDPDADTFIILRSPRIASQFANWSEEDTDDDESVASIAPSVKNNNNDDNAATLDNGTPAVRGNTPPHNPDSAQSEEEESTGDNTMSALLIDLKLNTTDTVKPDTPIAHDVENDKANAAILDRVPDNAPPHRPEGSISYHVSSRRLMLASTIFKSALSGGNWIEGQKKSDGHYYITADDWCEEVFLLLLNMLHLHSRQMPSKISLDMLAKLAVLTDYYDCAEAIESFTSIWIPSVDEKEAPVGYCRETIL